MIEVEGADRVEVEGADRVEVRGVTLVLQGGMSLQGVYCLIPALVPEPWNWNGGGRSPPVPKFL